MPGKGINKFNIFLLGLFIINMIQAGCTPLLGDEAHYWIWSQQMAWGYFDHPPMVAWMTRISSILFPGELGVRFMTVLLSTLTIPVVWRLIPMRDRQNTRAVPIFFGILLCIPIFHLYGFVTTPDAPLFFTFALYLLAFERFNKKGGLVSGLFLGCCAALLLYSKYHGGILILLSILFNWPVLKKPMTYLAGCVALLLLSPHLYWQYTHDFITFDYHLFQRTDGRFHLQNVLGYFPAVIGALNPAAIILLAYFSVKRRDTLSTTYRFPAWMFIGIVGFFFLYAFRSKVDAHWVGAAFIPMTLILFDICLRHEGYRRGMKYISMISMVVLLVLRIGVAIPVPQSIETEFHKEGKTFFQAIDKEADGKKVVFVNSYRRASKYSFYTGRESYSYDNAWYRKTHYDLLENDTAFHKKQVLLIGDYPSPFFDSVYLDNGEAYLSAVVDDFKVVSKVSAVVDERPDRLIQGQSSILAFELKNGHPYPLDFSDAVMPYELAIQFSDKGHKQYIPLQADIGILEPGETVRVNASFTTDKAVDHYTAALAIRSGYLYFQSISRDWPVEVSAGFR